MEMTLVVVNATRSAKDRNYGRNIAHNLVCRDSILVAKALTKENENRIDLIDCVAEGVQFFAICYQLTGDAVKSLADTVLTLVGPRCIEGGRRP